MYLNFFLFYWLRVLSAIIVLSLAILYLAGGEKIALIGFASLTFIVTIICNMLRKGTMPAACDLCKSKGSMKAEYGAGFSNARLILNCSNCGRIVNKAANGFNPQKE